MPSRICSKCGYRYDDELDNSCYAFDGAAWPKIPAGYARLDGDDTDFIIEEGGEDLLSHGVLIKESVSALIDEYFDNESLNEMGIREYIKAIVTGVIYS